MRQRPQRETEKTFMAAVLELAYLGHWRASFRIFLICVEM